VIIKYLVYLKTFIISLLLIIASNRIVFSDLSIQNQTHLQPQVLFRDAAEENCINSFIYFFII